MTHIAQFQDHPSITPFSRLRLHVERHAYKKGRYAGAAPADTSRRGKTHFRVELTHNGAAVVFHQTRILRAFDDGSIMLDSAGWHDSPTTRAAMQDALRLAGYKGWLTSKTLNGYKNTVLRLVGVRDDLGWSDGMTIARGGAVSGYAPLRAYRADKEARKAWRESAQEFKAVLPVLLAGIEAQGRTYHPFGLPRDLSDAALDPELWPKLAQYLAYKCGYDAPTAWAWLDRQVTGPMRVTVEDGYAVALDKA